MTRARDMANLGSQAGSGLDASDITTGVLPVGVTGGSGLTALASNPTVTLGSNATFPTGHVLQVVGDTYNASGIVLIALSAEDTLGSSLQVSINCASTDNYLLIQLFIPGVYNHADAGVSTHTGFRYHADFSGSDGEILGDREFIDSHNTYINSDVTLLSNTHISTFCAVPVSSTILIRPWFKSRADRTSGIFANSDASAGTETATLIVQEIQGA